MWLTVLVAADNLIAPDKMHLVCLCDLFPFNFFNLNYISSSGDLSGQI